MVHKSAAILMMFLITVSAFSAYGLVLGDCHDQSRCCCREAAMDGMMATGQVDKGMKIQAVKGCCCGMGAGDTCSLKTVAPSEKIGWALAPHRFDPPGINLIGIVSKDEVHKDSQAIIYIDAGSEATHPNSPPIYLTAMSFLI